jgi:hypothetical protein
MAARYQRVALLPEDPRLAPLLQHIEALADRATSHAHYLVKSDPGVPIVVKPWTNGDVDLARLIDTGLRLSDRAPEAWRQPVPADVIATLPTEDVIPADFDKDPNRFVYFSQAGRLYRVARRLGCTEARPCTFRDLNPAEVAEPGIGSCEPGTINCQAITYADGRREHTRTDPPVTAISGRLWPASMGVRLHDVPPGGLTFSEEEYKRHQAIYFPIMKLHEFGPNFIEDGIMYSHVRVCLVEQDGDDATCETAHYALKR